MLPFFCGINEQNWLDCPVRQGMFFRIFNSSKNMGGEDELQYAGNYFKSRASNFWVPACARITIR